LKELMAARAALAQKKYYNILLGIHAIGFK